MQLMWVITAFLMSWFCPDRSCSMRHLQAALLIYIGLGCLAELSAYIIAAVVTIDDASHAGPSIAESHVQGSYCDEPHHLT